jgi:hypothetical protein
MGRAERNFPPPVRRFAKGVNVASTGPLGNDVVEREAVSRTANFSNTTLPAFQGSTLIFAPESKRRSGGGSHSPWPASSPSQSR